MLCNECEKEIGRIRYENVGLCIECYSKICVYCENSGCWECKVEIKIRKEII